MKSLNGVTPTPASEKAGPPVNVTVKEVWGTNALVEWQPPKDDGNSEVTGYLIQKADKKTMVRDQRGLGLRGISWGAGQRADNRAGAAVRMSQLGKSRHRETGRTGWGWEGRLPTDIWGVMAFLSLIHIIKH